MNATLNFANICVDHIHEYQVLTLGSSFFAGSGKVSSLASSVKRWSHSYSRLLGQCSFWYSATRALFQWHTLYLTWWYQQYFQWDEQRRALGAIAGLFLLSLSCQARYKLKRVNKFLHMIQTSKEESTGKEIPSQIKQILKTKKDHKEGIQQLQWESSTDSSTNCRMVLHTAMNFHYARKADRSIVTL